MKLKDVNTMNQNALEKLECGDFITAQELFRQNAKNNIDFISLHNLGVFYMNEGVQLRNGRARSARNLSLKYLLSAAKYSLSYSNMMALGDWHFTYKYYKEASEYFRKACDIDTSYTSLNNLGVSMYFLREPMDAVRCFKKALEFCNNPDDIDKIFPSYVYAMLQNDKKQARDALYQLLKSNIKGIELDAFVLAFLCDDLQLAEALIKPMIRAWKLDVVVMAMVFECLLKLDKEGESQKILKYEINHLEGYSYNTKPEINSIKKAFTNSGYRNSAISSFLYIPLLIKPCYYIGCKQHNPR